MRPEILDRVLAAAHMAPSVGHSQPWRFIVVSEPATRERAARMADEQRLRQARQMEPDAARRLLDLQLEGIREAPLGLVVACDGVGRDAKVTVRFYEAGEKRVLARFLRRWAA